MNRIKKDVLFILPNLNAGGAERVSLNFVRQLDRKEFDVTLVVFDKTKDLLNLVPSHVRLVDLKTKKAIKSFLALLSLLRRNKPDFVYCTHSRVAVLISVIRILVGNFYWVARAPSMPSALKKAKYESRFQTFLYGAAYRGAHRVVAQTSEMASDIHQVYGVKLDKIRTILNPLDKELMASQMLESESPFPRGEFSIVLSGRISKEKNFCLLLQTLPQLKARVPNIHVYILGNKGNDFDNVKSLIDRLDISDSVTICGYVEQPFSYYQYCNLFVLTSNFEGFPNAFLENYYLGSPIVSTRCVPIVEQFVEEGISGYLVDVGDSVALVDAVFKASNLQRSKDLRPFSGGEIISIFKDE